MTRYLPDRPADVARVPRDGRKFGLREGREYGLTAFARRGHGAEAMSIDQERLFLRDIFLEQRLLRRSSDVWYASPNPL
jgi:hypothetical protein